MLSLDEPLDLKLPRGHINGNNRSSRSPPTLTPSPVHAKRTVHLHTADDGMMDIVPASPASSHTGKRCAFLRNMTTMYDHRLVCHNGALEQDL